MAGEVAAPVQAAGGPAIHPYEPREPLWTKQESAAAERRPRRGKWFAAVAAVTVSLVAVAFGWRAWDRVSGSAGAVGPAAMAPAPTVAVLPLENLLRDPSQDYFADGLTVEIVNRLAQFPDLSVIARNSALRYKGRAVDVQAAGRDLGVRYLVTGSVRRGDGRIRVAAQLVETETASYLWSETYDRVLTAESVFAIQDEIATAIAKTLADIYGIIRQAGLTEARSKPPSTLSSYDCVLLTMAWLRTVSREAHGKARDCLERAVENDPDYARAWSNFAVISAYGHLLGYDTRPGLLGRAHEAAHRGVALAPGDPDTHWQSAWTHYFLGDLDAFEAEVDRAVERAPKGASFLGNAGLFLAYAGEWERGLALIEEAKALDPFFPGGYHFGAFFDHYREHDYEAALAVAQKTDMPDYVWAQALIAAAYGQLGQVERARPTVARILELDPDFETTARAKRWRWFRYQEDLLDHFMDGLRKAGLDIPEEG